MRLVATFTTLFFGYLFGYGQTSEPTSTSSIIQHLDLADHYQRMLFIDSATYHAHQAMVMFRTNGRTGDSTLVARVYATYGNCMRNGGDYHQEVNMAKFDPELRCRFLKTFLDTALLYATSNTERSDIYLKMGTMFSDGVAKFRRDKLPVRQKLSVQSISFLKRSLELDNTNSAKIYSLIGLNYQYTLQYEKAELVYLKGLKEVTDNEDFFTLCNWRGGNLESWYESTKDVSLLIKADSIYQVAAERWRSNLNTTEVVGHNDAYQVSPINSLVLNDYRLFEITKDENYLHDAFRWADLTKYPRFDFQQVSVGNVQKLLDDSTAFVHYTFVRRPHRHVVFIIRNNGWDVLKIPSYRAMNTKRLKFLYSCDNISEFKKWSNLFYTGYFQQVDSLLTERGISNVVVSNSDQCSMLNLDVLIADTSAVFWQSLPFLFHQYRFSYALSARSFVEAHSKENRSASELGITIGNYENETELRFSEKLASNISEQFAAERTDIVSNLQENGASLLLFHGNSSYTERNAELLISSNDTLTVNDLYNMELDNDLVMVSACNTNNSRQFYSEGSTGSFTKALRYSGAKSTLTSSWWIDEKTNAFILERFICYLGRRMDKNKALWEAKNDYWNQCSSDDEFKPLYWASSVLTGNIRPVEITRRSWFSQNWYWVAATFALLLIVAYRRRFSFNSSPA